MAEKCVKTMASVKKRKENLLNDHVSKASHISLGWPNLEVFSIIWLGNCAHNLADDARQNPYSTSRQKDLALSYMGQEIRIAQPASRLVDDNVPSRRGNVHVGSMAA